MKLFVWFKSLCPHSFITIIFLHCIFCVNAQSFTPASENASLLNTLFTKYEKNYNYNIAHLPSENKKDFEEVYKHRWENIKDVFDRKEIYTSKSAQEYLDALFAKIVNANPLLKETSVNCYFSRSGVPNASYIGEGIILFNLGLFQKLSNESQAVFVLCHELSHFYLQHSENSIKKYVTSINSDEVQKELHAIKGSEYGKRSRLDILVKSLTFDTRRHGRDHEAQADSMAIEFMKNTGFDISESISVLALLDSIDAENFRTGEYLQNIFNSKEYPFKPSWIKEETGLLGGHAKPKEDKTLEDSLKTHPDCKARIEMIKPLVVKYSSSSNEKNKISAAKFNELRNTAPYEVTEYVYSLGNYTRSLYYTLQLLQSHADDQYLITQVGKTMNGFYNAQKEHTLSKVIDLPSPYHSSSYNILLQFVQNLYLQDLASINFNYLKQFTPKLDDYAPFKAVYSASSKAAN